MMQAFVSGQAARVAFVQGADVSYLNADRPLDKIKTNADSFGHLLLGADDVEQISVAAEEQAYPLLLKKFNFDRGLHLLDIALADEDEQFRIEAAIFFDKLIEHQPSLECIKNYVWAVENENFPNDGELLSLRAVAPKFVQFVEDVRKSQVHILRFNAALDRAFEALDVDGVTAKEFRFVAIDSGVFRGLVEAGSEPTEINKAILRCFTALAQIPSSRQIVQAWTKDVIHKSTKAEMRRLEKEIERYQDNSYVPKNASERSGYENFKAVKQQIAAIVERVKVRDTRTARRFADQLVKMQMQNGGATFAAKTLSSLAVEARKMGQYSLELEWAQASVELVPSDGWGVGLLADTYLRLSRIPEAEAAFRRSIELGEEEFGSSGLGRVQRACGKYDEALATFSNVKKKFAGRGGASETLGAYAETLRDLWREEEALEAYDSAIRAFPTDAALMCGKASLLAAMGRFEEASELYSFVNRHVGDFPAAWCGLADVRKLGGEWDDALDVYDRAIAKFPDNVIAVCGRADVLRSMGRLDDALAAYRAAARKFPYSPSPVSGEAETLKDMRRYFDALSTYKKAQQKFPLDQHLRNGLANALKLDGQFEEALRQFDLNVRDFPYNLYSLGGRAHLLRLLGNYDAALEAYNDIIAKRPEFRFAYNAKAAIFVAQKRFEEAAGILPDVDPITEVDWGTLHIRGMLLLRQGLLDEAKAVFLKGCGVPFFRQRAIFETALAIVNMKLGDLEGASQVIHSHKDSVSQLLSVHILMKQGESNVAMRRLAAVNDNLPSPVENLRIRLGEMLNNPVISESQELMLFDREIEVVLQAA